MLHLRYFASLREQLDCDSEQLVWQENLSTVADVKQALSERSDQWQQTLNQPSVLVAVNQVMGTMETLINDGDEIAFLPPVTGG